MTTPTRTLPLAFKRFRRLRRSEALRALVRETRLSPGDFVYPLFVTHGEGVREKISSMPGQFHLSLDQLRREAEELRSLGIPAVLLFGLPARKDEYGAEAYDSEGIVQRAIRTLKHAWPELVVITDVCLCEYTSHGHCGVGAGRGSRQRRDATAAGTRGHIARGGGGGYRRAVGHDGRAGRGHPRGARRRWFRADADHGVRGEAGVGVLRPLPCRRRVRPDFRGPPRLPDGRREQPRGDARDRG